MQHPGVSDATGLAVDEAMVQRFGQVYGELFPILYGHVRFRVGDPHIAEDLTAQIFERALTRLASVQQPDRIRAWLFTIARSVISNYRQRPKRSVSLTVADELKCLWVDSPEASAMRRDDRRRLMAYLAELSD